MAISTIVTDYEILREISLPPRPVYHEADTEESLITGKKLAASAKGMGTALVLTPFLGPLANVVGAAVAVNGMNKDSKTDPTTENYSPKEWRSKCKQDATAALRARGFPLKPPQLLDTLVAALKYNDLNSLVEILTNDRNTDARRGAVVALGYLSERAGPAIPLLVEELKHPDLALREQVSVSLRQIVRMRASADTVDPLVNLSISVTDTDVRHRAIVVLGEIGADADSAIPFLVSLLTDKNSDIRSQAAKSLGQIGTGAEEAVGALLNEAFTPRETPPNTNALRAIFFIKKKTKHVWQKLVAELTSQNAIHRDWAERLFLDLDRFVAKDAGPALVAALQTAGSEHRTVLMRMLSHADHELANQHRTPAEKARHAAAWTIGCSAMLAVPIILIALAVRGCGPATGHVNNSVTSPTPPIVNRAIVGDITEQEINQFFKWTPPDGWQRGESTRKTGLFGGKFLHQSATSTANSSATVTLDFKREQISDADMVARMERTLKGANALGAEVRRPPDQRWGTRTIHVFDNPTSHQHLRMYVWMIAERNLYCAISVKCAPAQFDAVLANLEPTFREALITASSSSAPSEISPSDSTSETVPNREPSTPISPKKSPDEAPAEGALPQNPPDSSLPP